MSAVLNVVLFCITCFGLHYASIVVHELGHVVGALLCGWKPLVMKVGSGPVRASFRIGDLEFRWTMVPYSGFAQAYAASPIFFRLREIVFALAGPVATGGVIAALGWAVTNELAASMPWLRSALRVSLMIEIGMLFAVVWPAWVTVDGQRLRNDMLIVCKAMMMSRKEVSEAVGAHIAGAALTFLERGESDRARRWLEHFERSSERMRFVDVEIVWIHLLRSVGRKDEAQAILQSVIDGKTEFNQSRSEALDALACLPIYYGHSDLLEDGLRLIEMAIAESPDAITLKGTKSSILIELGRVEEGLQLIDYVSAGTESENDRAIVAYYRALALAKLGDSGEAREALEKTLKDYPECIVRIRVASLVGQELGKGSGNAGKREEGQGAT